MKLSRRVWFIISGVSWLGIGMMLLMKGLRFVVASTEQGALVGWLARIAGSKQQGTLMLICLGLLIGFIKGRTVLAKTVKRIGARIRVAEQLSIHEVYDRKYYIVLAAMIGIGMIFRFVPIPLDVRGFVDVAIGSALMNGAMLYFREMLAPKKA